MSNPLRERASRVKATARRLISERNDMENRLRALEAEVQENRTLHRRVAELTDVVGELLLPVADRDEAKISEVLAEYRKGI